MQQCFPYTDFFGLLLFLICRLKAAKQGFLYHGLAGLAGLFFLGCLWLTTDLFVGLEELLGYRHNVHHCGTVFTCIHPLSVMGSDQPIVLRSFLDRNIYRRAAASLKWYPVYKQGSGMNRKGLTLRRTHHMEMENGL